MSGDDKGIDRLWYEYLKRSKDYQDYCELVRKGIDPFSTEKFKEFSEIHLNYSYNGDVHSLTFEEWYERKMVFREGLLNKDESIQAGPEVIRDLAKDCFNYFKSVKKADPSRDDLIEEMIRQVSRNQAVLFLKVDVTRCDTKELIGQFSKIVREKKKQRWTKILGEVIRLTHETKSKRINELRTYLKVYDLRKQQRKYEQIIEEIERNPFNPTIEGEKIRVYKRYNNKAKKIIKNAENGTFPGKY